MQNAKNLYVSPLLTNESLAYRAEGAINEEIFPFAPVKKDTAQIATYSSANLRIVQAIRAAGSRSNEVNHKVSIGDHYILVDHVLREYVTKEEIENADMPIVPRRDAMENLLDRMAVIREKAAADILNDGAVITNNVTLAGGDQWSDYVNSTPIQDIKAGMETVRKASGKRPNTFTISYDVLMVLCDHPDILARFPGKDTVTADDVIAIIPKIFVGITKVNVGVMQYDSEVEDSADTTLVDIWTKGFWIHYTEMKPKLKSRTFGRTYGRASERREVKVFPMNSDTDLADREADMVRVKDKYDQKVIDTDCMYAIYAAIA